MALDRARLPEPQAYYEQQGLVLRGRGAWRTTACAFHGGSDSMRIHLPSGGFCCMAGCGARGGDVLAYHMAERGLDFVAAARDLSAWDEEGEGAQQGTYRRRPAGLPARQALALLADDALLVAVAAANLAQGVQLTDADRECLARTVARISRIAEQVGV